MPNSRNRWDIEKNPKTSVAYFAPIFDNVIVGVNVSAAVIDAVHRHASATGTTAEAARKLAGITGGELFEIDPAMPYTDADLDWHDKQSRSSVEMNDPKSHPALKGKKGNMDACEVVYIGYPIG